MKGAAPAVRGTPLNYSAQHPHHLGWHGLATDERWKVGRRRMFRALVFFSFSFPSLVLAQENLVPESRAAAPSYWCTWGIQNYSRTDLDDMVHAQMADNL